MCTTNGDHGNKYRNPHAWGTRRAGPGEWSRRAPAPQPCNHRDSRMRRAAGTLHGGFCTTRILGTPGLGELDLAHTHACRRHFNTLILIHELKGLVE